MYELPDYASMVADRARMSAYAGALAEVVRPGSVVVDIGAGHGVLALMACKLGARRVFAIEVGQVIQIGRELARENGFEDRIEFIHADSRAVDLPQRADVVVSDLRGALPLFDDHLEVVVDARRRFLRDGGHLLPARDVLMAAVVSCPRAYDAHFGPEVAPYGVTLKAARARLENLPAFERDDPWAPELLVEPASWGTLEYAAVTADPLSSKLDWSVRRAGTAHGVMLWFEALVRPGWGYASGPSRPRDEIVVYGRVLLPFERPLPLDVSDRVEVDLWIGPRGDPMSWSVAVSDAAGRGKARWRKSTFLAAMDPPVRVGQGRRPGKVEGAAKCSP